MNRIKLWWRRRLMIQDMMHAGLARKEATQAIDRIIAENKPLDSHSKA